MTPQYPPDFEEAWRLYRSRGPANPNDSKSKGFRAWMQTVNARPAQEPLLACIDEYLDWLIGQHRECSRLRRPPFPAKAHFSTFISPRENKWEGFLEAAEARLRRLTQTAEERHAALPKEDGTGFWTRLRWDLGEEKFAAWFQGASYDEKGRRVLVPTTDFRLSWIGEQYKFALERAAGGPVTVSRPSEPPPARS